MKDKVFLIGGSGFVGKHIVSDWYGQYDISVFDRFVDADFFAQYPNVNCHVVDVTKDTIPEDVPNPDYIVNLASTMVTADRNLTGIGDLVKENLDIITRLFVRFKDDDKLKLFVQFGTMEEYGPGNPPLNEQMREQPNSAYSLMKQACTNYTMMLSHNEKYPACVVRPANLFGQGQHPQRFVPYVLHQLKEDLPLNVTPCEQKRDFIHIDDFVMLLQKVLEKSASFVGEVVNLSSGKSLALKDIIGCLQKETGSKSVVNYGALPYRDGEVMDLCCDNSHLMKLLGENIEINTLEKLIHYANE